MAAAKREELLSIVIHDGTQLVDRAIAHVLAGHKDQPTDRMLFSYVLMRRRTKALEKAIAKKKSAIKQREAFVLFKNMVTEFVGNVYLLKDLEWIEEFDQHVHVTPDKLQSFIGLMSEWHGVIGKDCDSSAMDKFKAEAEKAMADPLHIKHYLDTIDRYKLSAAHWHAPYSVEQLPLFYRIYSHRRKAGSDDDSDSDEGDDTKQETSEESEYEEDPPVDHARKRRRLVKLSDKPS